MPRAELPSWQDVGSKVYAIVTPQLGKEIATQAAANGLPGVAWNGGNVGGVEIVVSDAQTANRMTVVDASALAIADGGIDLRSSGQAAVEMETAPTGSSSAPTATSLVSMYQTNSRCLLAERSFAVKAIRPSAYAHLTNIALAEDSGSPALA